MHTSWRHRGRHCATCSAIYKCSRVVFSSASAPNGQLRKKKYLGAELFYSRKRFFLFAKELLTPAGKKKYRGAELFYSRKRFFLFAKEILTPAGKKKYRGAELFYSRKRFFLSAKELLTPRLKKKSHAQNPEGSKSRDCSSKCISCSLMRGTQSSTKSSVFRPARFRHSVSMYLTR